MRYGWTLDTTCWERLQKIVARCNWHRVPFSPLEKNEIPNSYGVYVFCAKPPNSRELEADDLLKNLFNAVYVGQTVNLRKRFVEHWTKPMSPMRYVRDCFSGTLEFWFTICKDQEELCLLEYVLIECLGPAANRQNGPVIEGKVGTATPA